MAGSEADWTAQRAVVDVPRQRRQVACRVTVGVRDDGKPDRRHVERKTKAEVTKVVRALARSVSPAGFGSPARRGRSGSGLSTGSRTSLRSTSARTAMTATKSTYVSSSCPASEPTSSIVWSLSTWRRFTPRCRRRGAPPTRLTTFTARSASPWKTFRRGHITINAAEIVSPPRPSVRPKRWSSFFASTRRNRSESQKARGALGGQGVC